MNNVFSLSSGSAGQSSEALSSLIRIYEYYTDKNRTNEAFGHFETAVKHYDRIARTYQGEGLEAVALSYKAELYQRQKNWEKTAEILTSIYDKFPQSEVGFTSLKNAIDTYKNRLNILFLQPDKRLLPE